jgi:hypothetical protein
MVRTSYDDRVAQDMGEKNGDTISKHRGVVVEIPDNLGAKRGT